VDNLVHSDVDFVNDTTGWTGSNELNAPMFKWTGAIQTSCLSITGPLEFVTADSICTVDSVIYSVHIDRTADANTRLGFNAVFYNEVFAQIGAQSVPDLALAGFPNNFVPDPGQTDIGTYYFTIFFTLAPTSEIVHFGIQVFPTQCTDDTSNMIINSVFQNITTCATVVQGLGTLNLDLSPCPQTGLVTYTTSYSYNGFPPLPGDEFDCTTVANGTYAVTFYVDNGVCVKTVDGFITCTTSLDDHGDKNFSLFPNPAGNHIMISPGSGLKIEEIRLYDLTGRLLMNQTGHQDSSDAIRIETGALSPGTYLISLQSSEGYWYTRKFVRN
jgi:Secretion system C-terminal sorting domain